MIITLITTNFRRRVLQALVNVEIRLTHYAEGVVDHLITSRNQNVRNVVILQQN